MVKKLCADFVFTKGLITPKKEARGGIQGEDAN